MPPRESVDLLIEPRWVLPIAPRNLALAGHAVAVRGGRIVAVAPRTVCESRFEPRERISRAGHALLPGFVNAHLSAASTLLRGLPVEPPLMRWLRQTVWPAEQRCMGPDFIRDGTQLAVAELLRAGVTAFGDAYLFPEEAARVAASARIRAVIGLPLAETPTAWAESVTAHLDKSERLWDEYKADPWVQLQFAPQPPYALGDETLIRLRRVADELDARIAMPLHETEVEVHDSLASHGRRPLRRLDDLGLLRPGFIAVHMNRINDEDLEIAARSGIAVVACPQSDLRLGSGTCPLAELAERGVPLALGSGHAASAGALDVLAEARAAALLMGTSAGGVHAKEAADALFLATLGGATVLGLASETGSIEPGKSADFACIDLSELACQPATEPHDAILFAATRQQVSDVWIAGHAVVADGKLLAFDEQELSDLAAQWSNRLQTGAAA